MTQPNDFRIAVADRDGAWRELTAGDPAPVDRVRAPSLSVAADRAARASKPVFVDVDVVLAESVRAALDLLDERHPGRPSSSIVHAGTVETLAGLLWDLWAAGVADGVTLIADDAEALAALITGRVVPLLAARRLPLQLRAPQAA